MLTNYIKLAFKVLARRKVFTFISLFGISLTLVVLMVATAILDNAFSPRPPESRFDRVLAVYTIGIYGDRGGITGGPGYAFVDKYVRGLPSAEKASAFTSTSRVVIYQDGNRIETHLKRTDGAYWQIMDFDFVEGGPFTQADDDNANFVAVITDDMRARLFGGASALGRTVEIEGQRYRVIGVVRAVPIIRYAAFSQIWAPIHTQKGTRWQTQLTGNFNAIVLARSSDDFPRLRREFAEKLTHFVFDDPEFTRVVAGLDTTFEAFSRSLFPREFGSRRPAVVGAFMLLAVLAFVTLPTMNLVSINLSRIMERASEIGVRKAFGASSRALVGQFVVENVVLTLIGGVIGFVLAVVALEAIARADLLPYARFEVNPRVFFYGMVVAALFGILSGVYPAWRMSRMQAVSALRGGAE